MINIFVKLYRKLDDAIGFTERGRRNLQIAESGLNVDLTCDDIKPLLKKGEPVHNQACFVFFENHDGTLSRVMKAMHFCHTAGMWDDGVKPDFYIEVKQWNEQIDIIRKNKTIWL